MSVSVAVAVAVAVAVSVPVPPQLAVSGDMQILTLSYDWQEHACAWSPTVSAQLLLLIARPLLERLLSDFIASYEKTATCQSAKCQAMQIELYCVFGSFCCAPVAKSGEASGGEFLRASSVEMQLAVSTAAHLTICSNASIYVHVSAYSQAVKL
jgi:hypothetical protein